VVNPQRRGRTALLATAEDELHQVGLLMVAAVFEMHGWDTVYPGAGVSVQTLTELVDAEGPDLLGLSLTVGFHGPRLQAMLARLRVHHPTLPILIGGQGLRAVGAQISADLARVQRIDSLDRLGAYLEHAWRASPD
jgi:methanogenic corrinoid protein MtbC1